MNISIFDVKQVQLVTEYLSNSNQRSIAITCVDFKGHESCVVINFYGETVDLASLPRTTEFLNVDLAQELAQ